jgi:hypothetical protein
MAIAGYSERSFIVVMELACPGVREVEVER